MPSPIEVWFYSIPPITRTYVTASCLTSLAIQFDFVHPLHLWLSYDRIIHDHQWWRLITNFLYFGPLSIDFVFHMFFLSRYSTMLEEGFFYNKPAEYLWLLIFSAMSLIAMSVILPSVFMPFLGPPLAFTMVYIWSRRNPYTRLQFMGLGTFRAPHLPWVLLSFSLMIGGQAPVGDLLGIGVGHIYYFFEDVWPRDPASGGKHWLATPRILYRLVQGNVRQRDQVEIPQQEPEVQDLAEDETAVPGEDTNENDRRQPVAAAEQD